MKGNDTIRKALTKRALQLDRSSYSIGKAIKMDPGTIHRYLHGMNRSDEDGNIKRVHIALNSRYVSAIAAELKMELRPKN